MDVEYIDVVVVGAGFAGLSVAKTYLQCSPGTTLAIFDDHATIGGVWSLERLYPDLKTNNLLGTFEMPDFPMHKGYGVGSGQHIPGAVVHQYLQDYAAHFDLTRRIRLQTKVVSARKLGGTEVMNAGWSLEVLESLKNSLGQSSTETRTIVCKKLIVSTGLTSQAIPRRHIRGEEDFGASIMTSATIAADAPNTLHSTSEKRQCITVLGGSKSSYDFVWIFASRGYNVNWIIRKHGFGPGRICSPCTCLQLAYHGGGLAPLLPPHLRLGPLRLRMEKLTCTRLLSWLAPCLWSAKKKSSRFQSSVQWMLHRSALGRSLVKFLWADIGSKILHQTLGVRSKVCDSTLDDNGLHKLVPDENVVWYATKTGVLNYPDTPSHRGGIHAFIRTGQVKVYREDIDHLSSNTVHLADANGTALPSPAGIAVATSWSTAPNIAFLQTDLHAELGIPSSHYSDAQKAFWHALDSRANEEIITFLPWLREAPKGPSATVKSEQSMQSKENAISDPNTNLDAKSESKCDSVHEPPASSEPIRLYRFMAPPGLTARGDHSIVFNGFVSNVANTMRLEVSALWCYAYLNGQLPHLAEATSPEPGHTAAGASADKLQRETTMEHERAGEATTRKIDVCYQAALYNAYTRRRFPYGYGAKIPDFEFEQMPYFDELLRDLGLSWRRKKDWLSDILLPYGPEDYRGLVAEWLSMKR